MLSMDCQFIYNWCYMIMYWNTFQWMAYKGMMTNTTFINLSILNLPMERSNWWLFVLLPKFIFLWVKEIIFSYFLRLTISWSVLNIVSFINKYLLLVKKIGNRTNSFFRSNMYIINIFKPRPKSWQKYTKHFTCNLMTIFAQLRV